MVRVLGISCGYHDSAACLLEDGVIVAAAQEERFSRRKHDSAFPLEAIRYCLAEAGSTELDAVAFYDKPILKLHRILETSLGTAPRGLRPFLHAVPTWLRDKLWIEPTIHESLGALGVPGEPRVWFPEHHLSHAASAFHPSPFDEAAIVTLDGVGEWATGSIGDGRGREIRLLEELRFPHSLGLLYSAFTHFCGFEVLEGEYKLMGLAPYGEPRYVQVILERLMDLKEDGSFRLDLSYFGYLDGLTMTNDRFAALFGGPARAPESEITTRERDLARSIQAVTEEVVLRVARHAHRLTGRRALCMAGGVALNCVANGQLLREGPFDELWIQPASGDAGGAVGAAYAAWHGALGGERPSTSGDRMQGALLGPEFSAAEIRAFLDARGRRYETLEEDDAWAARLAELLAAGRVVGLFQGRMELGPRALGNRSILADPRLSHMQDVLNAKIKQRETFRPFAPSVPRERSAEWFDLDRDSPYMLLVAPVRGALPAVTHVDGTARLQTVERDVSPRYHALLEAFGARTGCPVLVNTSFNVRGEPIVCTPEDALRCYDATGMDALSLGPHVLLADGAV